MENYPNTSKEFQSQFVDEQDCINYLIQVRWPDGYVCPFCGAKESFWFTERYLLKCSKCRRRHSILSDTVFQGTHTPLLAWFRIMWHICLQKNGYSALSIQRSLGISYPTAWLCLHKLRKAMVHNDQDLLSGEVEVDECYVGGVCKGRRGRGGDGKSIVMVAAEKRILPKTGRTVFGRIRLRCISNVSSEVLCGTIKELIAPGSTICTDGWKGYKRLQSEGYCHIVFRQSTKKDKTPFESDIQVNDDSSLPLCHRVISLLNRWILGTLQGSIGKDHVQDYLNEFTFRFNRRSSKYRGKLFWRLVQMTLNHLPTTQHEITKY